MEYSYPSGMMTNASLIDLLGVLTPLMGPRKLQRNFVWSTRSHHAFDKPCTLDRGLCVIGTHDTNS